MIYRQAIPKKAATHNRDKEKMICLLANGDSMAPRIQDGSLVAIDIDDRREIHRNKNYGVEIPAAGVTIRRVNETGENSFYLQTIRQSPAFPITFAPKVLTTTLPAGGWSGLGINSKGL